jgi:hypothetical protein
VGANPDPYFTLGQADLVVFESAKLADQRVVDFVPIKSGLMSVTVSDYFRFGPPEAIDFPVTPMTEGTFKTPLKIRVVDDDALKNDLIADLDIPYDTLVEGDNEIDCAGTGLERLVIRVVEANVSQPRLLKRLRVPVKPAR